MTVTAAMAPSTEIRDTMLEFYRRMLAGESFAFQQFQLRIAELFALRPVLLNSLQPQPFLEHTDLHVRPFQFALQPLDLFGFGGARDGHRCSHVG